ncbi:hypothetical protein P8C59_006165 [Phyllachora maydis]|uniref:18S rRNA factor 2 n=1 Tax=Phyllachora maydis TaxID=1825666 RepID=A0AAD9I5Z2_9PEZI|nr:hypothetical protein P8C59_006165 [Phyllachora maydis]
MTSKPRIHEKFAMHSRRKRNEFLDDSNDDSNDESDQDHSSEEEVEKGGRKDADLHDLETTEIAATEDAETSLATTPKPLFKKNLVVTDKAVKKSGVVYISRIPPYMKPAKLRNLLEPFGKINRTFLTPEDPQAHARRVRNGGNKRKLFTEGWVEFVDKKKAKSICELLNGQIIGGKKGNFYHDDIWNLRYLKNFKWYNLTEQIAREQAERASRMRAEISKTTRENKEFIRNVELGKQLEGMQSKASAKRKKIFQDDGGETKRKRFHMHIEANSISISMERTYQLWTEMQKSEEEVSSMTVSVCLQGLGIASDIERVAELQGYIKRLFDENPQLKCRRRSGPEPLEMQILNRFKTDWADLAVWTRAPEYWICSAFGRCIAAIIEQRTLTEYIDDNCSPRASDHSERPRRKESSSSSGASIFADENPMDALKKGSGEKETAPAHATQLGRPAFGSISSKKTPRRMSLVPTKTIDDTTHDDPSKPVGTNRTNALADSITSRRTLDSGSLWPLVPQFATPSSSNPRMADTVPRPKTLAPTSTEPDTSRLPLFTYENVSAPREKLGGFGAPSRPSSAAPARSEVFAGALHRTQKFPIFAHSAANRKEMTPSKDGIAPSSHGSELSPEEDMRGPKHHVVSEAASQFDL